MQNFVNKKIYVLPCLTYTNYTFVILTVLKKRHYSFVPQKLLIRKFNAYIGSVSPFGKLQTQLTFIK